MQTQPPSANGSGRSRPGIDRPLALILFTVFLDVLGLGLIVPVAPFYARAFGADALQIGLLFTVFSIMQLLTTPILGALSDRYGRRPILMFSLAGEAVGYLILGLANSLPILFLARIVTGGTAGNIGAAQAYLADITPPKERTARFGLFGAAFGVGFLFGPALGGLLSGWDLRAPAFAAAGLVALNVLFAYFFLPESLPRERRAPISIRETLNPLGTLTTLMRRAPLRAPLLVTFLANFSFAAFQTNFAVFVADRFGYGPTDVGAFFFAQGIVSIVMQLVVIRRLSQHFSDALILLAGVAVTGVAYAMIGALPDPFLLWIALPLLAAGGSLWRAPLAGMISKLVGGHEQGLAGGGSQATASLAAVIGPIVGGLAYEGISQSAPYWLGAVTMVLAAIVVEFGTRHTSAPHPPASVPWDQAPGSGDAAAPVSSPRTGRP